MTRAPDIQLFGHAVLIQGRALTTLVHFAVAGASAVTRRDGHVTPQTLELIDVMRRADIAARAQSGHADVRTAPDPRKSDSLLVGTREVAGQLRVSERHVRRLAAEGELPGHRSRQGWRFRESEVQAYQAQHDQEENQ